MGISYVSLGLAGIAFATPRVFNALYPPTVERASLDEKIHNFFNTIREKIYSPPLQTTSASREEIGLPLEYIEGKVKKLFALGIPLRKKINQLNSPNSYDVFFTVVLPDNLWLSTLVISFLWQKIFLNVEFPREVLLVLSVTSLYIFYILMCCYCFHALRVFLSPFLPLKLSRFIAPSSNLLEPTARDHAKEFIAFCERYRREEKSKRRRAAGGV